MPLPGGVAGAADPGTAVAAVVGLTSLHADVLAAVLACLSATSLAMLGTTCRVLRAAAAATLAVRRALHLNRYYGGCGFGEQLNVRGVATVHAGLWTDLIANRMTLLTSISLSGMAIPLPFGEVLGCLAGLSGTLKDLNLSTVRFAPPHVSSGWTHEAETVAISSPETVRPEQPVLTPGASYDPEQLPPLTALRNFRCSNAVFYSRSEPLDLCWASPNLDAFELDQCELNAGYSFAPQAWPGRQSHILCCVAAICKSLKRISLRACRDFGGGLSVADVQTLGQHAPGLEYLDITMQMALMDMDPPMHTIARRFANLRGIAMQGLWVTDEALGTLATGCGQLRHLWLCWCRNFSAEGLGLALRSFGRLGAEDECEGGRNRTTDDAACPRGLYSLDLSGTGGAVAEESMLALMESHGSTLRSLVVDDNEHFTRGFAERVSKACSKLDRLVCAVDHRVDLPHVDDIPRDSVAPVGKEYLFGQPVHVELTGGSINLDLWPRSDCAAPAAAVDVSQTGAVTGRDGGGSDDAPATLVVAASPIRILACQALYIDAGRCPTVFKNLEYLLVDGLKTELAGEPLVKHLQQQLPSLKAAIVDGRTILTRNAFSKAEERDVLEVLQQALSASMFQYAASLE